MRTILYMEVGLLVAIGTILIIGANQAGQFYPGIYWAGFGVIAFAGAILIGLIWTSKKLRTFKFKRLFNG